MTDYAIDTSALVKLVVPEDHSETVSEIALLHTTSAIQLIAPEFILLECSNVLWKYARRHAAPIADVTAAMDTLKTLQIQLISQDLLMDDALTFALDVGIPVYDALFSMVAQRNQIALITADNKLVNELLDTGVETITLAAWTRTS